MPKAKTGSSGSEAVGVFSKAPVKPEAVAVSELPAAYDKTKLVLMPRDPYWIYAYWMFSSADAAKVPRDKDLSLRISKNGQHVRNLIVSGTLNWYIQAEPDGDYLAELGYYLENGEFVSLVVSNAVRTPRSGPSNVCDEKWSVTEAQAKQIYELSGGEEVEELERVSGSERLMKKRFGSRSQGSGIGQGSGRSKK
jgi:hypothetical protein